jgi:hypothetical protein
MDWFQNYHIAQSNKVFYLVFTYLKMVQTKVVNLS